jgi:fructose 1,6-bisphosphatase
MATIGSTRYTAIVRIHTGKTVVHQEYNTFAHRVAAVTWAKHREVALEDPAALVRVQQGAPTLAELIRWYIDTFEIISKWQRSKQVTPSAKTTA